ncbi:MAG: potassium/proton antiporter [Solirubrobacterales bacterium]
MSAPLAVVGESELILITGALLAAGIAAAMMADRLKVPGLLLFLGLGMLIGSEGPGGVMFDDAELTRTLGVIGLSLILFEGGLSAGWREIRPVVGVALSLAIVGTAVTSVVAGLAAMWLLDLEPLQGLIVGAAVAATDSAAIFAVLRGSTLRRRLARTLEGESGMNDPVALLLVMGFISWIQLPDYGLDDLLVAFAGDLGLGVLLGVVVGIAARWAFVNLNYPTAGLYPVASVAAAALSYGSAEVAGGSGFFAVYVTGLMLGTGSVPALRTVTSFHVGVGWVAQIAFFFVLGLLVVPSQLVDVATEGVLLSAALIFVARPFATLVATAFTSFGVAEKVMLSWAGLRGAIPIWLATFPVVAGIGGSEQLFAIVFFVVVSTTLIQGISFEPLAVRLGLTTDEPALPTPLHESGRIRRLGGEVLVFRVPQDAAAVGLMIKELGLPREALVNVIVRDGEALAPRGSTRVQPDDEMHVLVRHELRSEVRALTERWHTGPIGEPPPPRLPFRASPSIFSVKPWDADEGDCSAPATVDGAAVVSHLRTRRDHPGALVALADGRYAATGPDFVAVGGRALLARWCARRADRDGDDDQARAWWQEVIGTLRTPGMP